MQPVSPFRFRPFWGMVLGAVLGSVLLTLIAVQGVLFEFDALEEQAGSVEAAVALYLFSGALGGLIFGALLPLARKPVGAALVGVASVTPFYVLQSKLLPVAADSASLPWWLLGLICIGVGGLSGYLVRTRLFPEIDQ